MHLLIEKLSLLPNAFLLAWGWPRRGLCLLLGAVSALALPPFGLFPILFLTLPAFVWLLDGALETGKSGAFKQVRTGFVLGWLFGFGYYLSGLWWIGSAFLVEAERFAWLMPFAIVAMPAGLALFTGLGAALAGFFWGDTRWRILLLAAAMTLADWLKGTVLTGFPWNAFGYAFSESLVLAQTASLVGLYGLSFLAWGVFAMLAVLADSRPLSQRLLPVAAATAVLISMAGYGGYRLMASETEYEDLDIRIVQPAVSQKDKWQPELRDQIFQTYLDMTEAPLGGGARVGVPRLVVWPESSIPFLLTREPGALRRISAALGTHNELAVGAVRVEAGENGPLYFNSIYTITGDGAVSGLYDKVRLVPFGEYVPFKQVLDQVGISNLAGPGVGFQAGFQRRPLTVFEDFSFLPLICYEAIFPVITASASPRPAFFLNVTNDAWFGHTPGPYQHFAQAQLRSIETGVPTVRAANTGISGMIDGHGRILSKLAIFDKGLIDAKLPKQIDETFYRSFQNAPVLIISIIIVIFSSIRRYNRFSRLN
ncbi:apolipoprotein N-acyltransferase [Labrenzia sp. PHM005]|uniref:apolipoprotein N-acyltransferase n=1 Tax=Labrenzia sp. PHM005 TaxID=2590016 RepID=UPI001140121A|nr:apolipoprotein N-acyltransferase [Labrenzia sp. PHM005]QDG74767.1 apolipoprotein N-acyltransferase [Labrenzia sp. PHM005]